MAWGRLVQLGKPVVRTMADSHQGCGSMAVIDFRAMSWWRSMSSYPTMESFGSSLGENACRDVEADSMASSRACVDAVVCGRGDKKTKRGKRFKHSFGNPRESRGVTTRRLRKKWDLPFDPLVPVQSQPFPPLLS